ncbi:MAG TPA: hypothetical protein DIT92_01795, partial [Anaerovibrio sp.]|nr:hypothetical protein [Anaerovibrio sp.]
LHFQSSSYVYTLEKRRKRSTIGTLALSSLPSGTKFILDLWLEFTKYQGKICPHVDLFLLYFCLI